MLSPKRWIEI